MVPPANRSSGIAIRVRHGLAAKYPDHRIAREASRHSLVRVAKKDK